MISLLQILACFAGVFAFAFVVAGLAGLAMPENDGRSGIGSGPSPSQMVDMLLTGGCFTLISNIGKNWEHRPAERRMLFGGIGLALVCLMLIAAVKEYAGE